MKIQVGRTYYSVDGCEYHITSKRGPYVYTDGQGHEWEEDGYFLSCYDGGNPSFDLVEERDRVK